MPRNPFTEFNEDSQTEPSDLQDERPTSSGGVLSVAQNPFGEFVDETRRETARPMDEILASHDSTMARLTEAYRTLIAECIGDGMWQADRQMIEKTYAMALHIVGEIDWEMSDVEAFCSHALQSSDPAFFVMEPLGLFLSAFCNASSLTEIQLDLSGHDLRLSLMGYQLREGVALTLVGDYGDLTGISLAGGTLKVNGNVRHYLGAGMASGKIEVSGNAGRFIGQQMQGGEIHIGGRLGGVGNPGGGTIYHRQQVIYGS